MGFKFSLTDNSSEIKRAKKRQIAAALEAVGIQAEGDVKGYITSKKIVDTGRLRQSIAHLAIPDAQCVYVGSNLDYAVYVHEGTGMYASGGTTKTRWAYQDPVTGDWRIGVPQRPRRFLRDAIKARIDEYKSIVQAYLTR